MENTDILILPSPSYYMSLSILMFYLRGKNATSPKFASQLARIIWSVPPTELHIIFFNGISGLVIAGGINSQGSLDVHISLPLPISL